MVLTLSTMLSHKKETDFAVFSFVIKQELNPSSVSSKKTSHNCGVFFTYLKPYDVKQNPRQYQASTTRFTWLFDDGDYSSDGKPFIVASLFSLHKDGWRKLSTATAQNGEQNVTGVPRQTAGGAQMRLCGGTARSGDGSGTGGWKRETDCEFGNCSQKEKYGWKLLNLCGGNTSSRDWLRLLGFRNPRDL